MQIIQAPTPRLDQKVCLAIGVFDGVHLGHQQVIRQALCDAREHEAMAVVVTFDRHPNAVVAPTRVPELIQTLPQRLQTIEDLKVDTTLLIPFTPAFSQWKGVEFIEYLLKGFGAIQSICVGSTFTFGHQRSGNVELLKQLGQKHHFQVHGLGAVSWENAVISSTRIRESIREGDLDAAGQMLGRPYALGGQVSSGDRLGHQLGFPTANLDVTGLVLPPRGVYAGHVEWKKRIYRAALNIGIRPTVEQPVPSVRAEVHILDFQEDLYGQHLEITLGRKIREEKKFASLDELKKQIERDISMVRAD